MTDEELVDALKALGHPVRLRIMQALSGVERNVGEIEAAAGIGQPTLSQQLAVLRKAGLVVTRKQAKLVYYRIDESQLAPITAATRELGGASEAADGASNDPHASASRRPSPGAANFAKMG